VAELVPRVSTAHATASIRNLSIDFLSTEFVHARACMRVGHPALVNLRLFCNRQNRLMPAGQRSTGWRTAMTVGAESGERVAYIAAKQGTLSALGKDLHLMG